MAEKGVTGIIKEAKHAKGKTWEGLAEAIGCNAIFLCSVVMGQNLIDPVKGAKLCDLLGLDGHVLAQITQCHPVKAQGDWNVLKQDPLLNRLHEINLVYGMAIKEMIHEKFGDGIMSAVDFECYIDRIEDPKGDRVKLTFNGKFLPYRKW